MLRSKIARRGITASMALFALLGTLPGTTSAATGTTPTPTMAALCPESAPGAVRCFAEFRTDIPSTPASAVTAQTTLAGYSPADLRSAYSLPSGTAGSGMTVAVVVAYDHPSAEADLGVYRAQFGLSTCTVANGCFRRVDQNGGTAYPDRGQNPFDGTFPWDGETQLDLDMVSAVCPNCHILLVEATDLTIASFATAANKAASLGAIAVSNSYGLPETAATDAYDGYYNHPGVAMVVASGDSGYKMTGVTKAIAYPAASPYVVAVGGTTLTRASNARGWSETPWVSTDPLGGTGSGCSPTELKPTWQRDTGCVMRTVADVSAIAGKPGVATYVSTPVDPNKSPGWIAAGGTSAAAPIVAAMYALAGGPTPGAYPALSLYASSAGLNDVSGGVSNDLFNQCTSGSYLCNAVSGYDGPTGLGTPNGIGPFTGPRSYSDFNGDRNADIVSRDSSGNLLLYPHTPLGFGTSTQIGHGWNGMTALIAGDFNGDGNADIVSRDSAGTLWLYPHTPSGFVSPTQIGLDWNSMTAMMAADFTGDGSADIIARDSSGVLWLYPHTPSGFGSFSQIGHGWNGMTAMVAADFTGDGNADIIAIDSSGTLWLYPHTPAGFGTARQIYTGWSGMTALVAGDFDGDGNADIVARDGSGQLWLYPHTPSGFVTSQIRVIGHGWNGMTIIL